MAAFAPVITGIQSSDGLTLTLTDGSNYGSNNEGYIISNFTTRNVVLTASDNSVLATLPLGSGLTVTYPLTADKYITATLVLAGVAPYSTFINLPLGRITQNLYQVLLASVGCCANHSTNEKLEAGDIYFRGCDLAGISGNGLSFDSNISSAFKYLNS
jgi:hypothetical protein